MPGDWPSKSELFGTFETLSERLDDLDTRVAGGVAAGLPTGGVAGEVLTKDSGTDYDASWQAGGAGVDPSQVKVLLTAADNPFRDPNIFGAVVGDTIAVRGPDGTAGSIPSWFSYDPTPDVNYGFGLRFNESGLYYIHFTLAGDWGGCDLVNCFVEFLNKVSGREASWNMFHTRLGPGIGANSIGVMLHVVPVPLSNLVEQVYANVVEQGVFYGFTIYSQAVVGVPAGPSTFTIDLSINRVA